MAEISKNIANRIPITGALMLATLMNTIDSTIANVALPHMQGSLVAAQDQITWVLTSYILATAIMTPLSGWLSLKFGRRPMFLWSIAMFTVASMLCGVATSLPEIVLFRFLQGCAGASLIPLSQSTMLDLFPQQLLSQAMSVWSAAIILGPVFGPTLGGWLTENFSWRWVFFINLPVGMLAFAGIYIFMSGGDEGLQRPFDVLGFGSLVAFMAAFQLLIDRGPGADWFSSKEIWIEALAAAIGLWLFAVQTATAKHPFFHRDLAKDTNYVSCTVFGVFVNGLLFSTSALLPSFMQNLLGYSALQSGMASMPRGVGSLVSFLAVPYLIRALTPRPVIIIGLCLSMAALWQIAHFDLQMDIVPLLTSGAVQGIGVGLLFAPLNTFAYATLAPTHRTEATIVATMVRSLGSSVGISVLQASLLNGSAAAHARLAEHIIGGDPVVAAGLPAAMSPSTQIGLAALNAEITRQATMVSYDTIFAWMTLGVACLFPLLLLMRPPAPGQPAAPIEAPVE